MDVVRTLCNVRTQVGWETIYSLLTWKLNTPLKILLNVFKGTFRLVPKNVACYFFLPHLPVFMCFLLRLVAHSKFSQVPTLKFLPIFDAFWLLLSFRFGCVCWKSLCQKHLQSKCNFMQIRCRCCCWTRMHLTAQVNTKLDWIMHRHSCVYLVNGNLQEALEAYPVIACQKYYPYPVFY